MAENGNINWFPGHMAKAKRQMQEDIKLIDVVAEVVDARIPISSRNSDISELIAGKPRVIILNKSDLADPKHTEQWIKYYKKNNVDAVSMECNSGKGMDFFIKSIKHVMSEKLARWSAKGMIGKTIKVMVLGEPNTGKSSLINKLSKKARVKVENRPGVTRGNQWITVDKSIELLDTPGVLPPKIKGRVSQNNLAITGAIRDDILDIEQISTELLRVLAGNCPKSLQERYGLEFNEETLPFEIMNMIGKKRGFLISGGEVDLERVYKMLLSEFRSGKLGRVTLEKVQDMEDINVGNP